MARQSSGRRNAEDHETDEVGDLDILGGAASDPEDDDADGQGRDAATDQLWSDVRVAPVEIALPTGTGYTLRAYRSAAELTPTEVQDDEDDPFAVLAQRRTVTEDDDETVVFDDDLSDRVVAEDSDAARDPDAAAGDEADDAVDDDGVPDGDETTDSEEVPAFLSHKGKLFLFRTPEALVEFVQSDAEHDLSQLDTWAELTERIRPEDVTPLPDDSYELDLVVENLRGGHDAWDSELLIEAGEIARDVGYALRIEPLLAALAADSPLDDLDEALRAGAAGGVGGFLARRRVRKIGIQQATLGWRTIIGKISGAVVWRE